MDKEKQLDLFGDFRKQTELMHSIGGFFIGRFTDDKERPIQRLSRYYEIDEESTARADLEAGDWEPPEPEI